MKSLTSGILLPLFFLLIISCRQRAAIQNNSSNQSAPIPGKIQIFFFRLPSKDELNKVQDLIGEPTFNPQFCNMTYIFALKKGLTADMATELLKNDSLIQFVKISEKPCVDFGFQ